MLRYILFLLMFSSSVSTSERGTGKTGDDLIRYLLANSSNVVRPVINRENPITVTLGLELIQIISLAEIEQSLTCKFWIRLSWKNELMKWNAREWGGTKHTQVRPSQIWTPDIMLYNNLGDSQGGGTQTYNPGVNMYPNGTNFWLSPITYKSSCNINVAHFPFDEQKCELKLGSWTLNTDFLKMEIENKSLVTFNYVPSPEWDITSIRYFKNTVPYEYQDSIRYYDDITVRIEISRKSLGYLFYMVTPCLLLVVTTLFSFSLPPESKAKIVVIITNLLAFFVFLTLTNEILPKRSDVIPTITLFYLVLMIECVGTLLMACSVMTTYHFGTQLHPPAIPDWIRWIFGKICFAFNRQNVFKSPANDTSRRITPSLYKVGETIKLITLMFPGYDVESEYNMEKYTVEGEKKEAELAMKCIRREINFLIETKKRYEKRNTLQNDWKYLAHLMDKVYYWVFIFCATLSSAYILGISYLQRIKYTE